MQRMITARWSQCYQLVTELSHWTFIADSKQTLNHKRSVLGQHRNTTDVDRLTPVHVGNGVKIQVLPPPSSLLYYYYYYY